MYNLILHIFFSGYSGYYPTTQQVAPRQGGPPIFPSGMRDPAVQVHYHELDGIEMKIADKYQQANKVG
jgi:hypothetical protein